MRCNIKNDKLLGILALQGDYAAHASVLQQLGVNTTRITQPEQLTTISALIIPGGESTVLLKLMQPWNFITAIKDFYHQQKPIFGTCAGLILMAQHVEPQQQSLGLLDIDVKRNAYGRQIDSFIDSGETVLKNTPMEMVFIRAPKITKLGPDVKVLAQYHQQPVLVQQDHILAASFHPELSTDNTVHQYFMTMVKRQHKP